MNPSHNKSCKVYMGKVQCQETKISLVLSKEINPDYNKFCRAIRKANIKKIQSKISKGINLNPTLPHKIYNSYLNYAICNEVTEDTIENNINKKSVIPRIKSLFQKGEPTDKIQSLWSSLKHTFSHNISADSRLHIIEILIQNGADINGKEYKNLTPLETTLFVPTPNLRIVRILIDYGIEVTDDHIHIASQHGSSYESLMNLLIGSKTINIASAIRNNLPNTVKSFIRKGLPIKPKYLRKAKTHDSKETWIVLIEYFRVFTRFGAKSGNYARISKQGIVGVHGISIEFAEYIARFV